MVTSRFGLVFAASLFLASTASFAGEIDELKRIVAVQQSQIALLQARQDTTYLHNMTYCNGIAPTITDTSGASLGVYQGDFIPYQLKDGSWRLKFNIVVLLQSMMRTRAEIEINGVTFFKALDGQAVSGGSAYRAAHFHSYAVPESGKIVTLHGPAEGGTGEYMWSGDVKLASKPTWAY